MLHFWIGSNRGILNPGGQMKHFPPSRCQKMLNRVSQFIFQFPGSYVPNLSPYLSHFPESRRKNNLHELLQKPIVDPLFKYLLKSWKCFIWLKGLSPSALCRLWRIVSTVVRVDAPLGTRRLVAAYNQIIKCYSC